MARNSAPSVIRYGVCALFCVALGAVFLGMGTDVRSRMAAHAQLMEGLHGSGKELLGRFHVDMAAGTVAKSGIGVQARAIAVKLCIGMAAFAAFLLLVKPLIVADHALAMRCIGKPCFAKRRCSAYGWRRAFPMALHAVFPFMLRMVARLAAKSLAMLFVPPILAGDSIIFVAEGAIPAFVAVVMANRARCSGICCGMICLECRIKYCFVAGVALHGLGSNAQFMVAVNAFDAGCYMPFVFKHNRPSAVLKQRLLRLALRLFPWQSIANQGDGSQKGQQTKINQAFPGHGFPRWCVVMASVALFCGALAWWVETYQQTREPCLEPCKGFFA